jgi:hypothetical protein
MIVYIFHYIRRFLVIYERLNTLWLLCRICKQVEWLDQVTHLSQIISLKIFKIHLEFLMSYSRKDGMVLTILKEMFK